MKRNKISQTKDVLTESLPGCQWKQSKKEMLVKAIKIPIHLLVLEGHVFSHSNTHSHAKTRHVEKKNEAKLF